MNIYTHNDFWYEITLYVFDVVTRFIDILVNEVGAGISDWDSTVTFVTLLLMCGIWLLMTFLLYKLACYFVSYILKLFGGF